MVRRRVGRVLIGLLFVVAGIIYGGNVLNVWDIDLFFDGWWTLFIIVPCLLSMVDDGVNFGNVLGLGVGAILLLWAQDMMPDMSYKLIFPFILVLIGIRVIFGRVFSVNRERVKINRPRDGKYADIIGIFCGNEANYSNMPFNGADCVAIFGGVELDLRGAQITEDCVINAYAIFGGVDIFLPPNVRVFVDSTPIFGGCSNKAISSTDENAPKVLITSVTIFGGTEIK